MKTQTHSNTAVRNLFGPETFSDNWIIVADRNDCDVLVTVRDLIEYEPADSHVYEMVYYDNQSWWIPQELHFPM